jgi:hypothetical protein
MVKIDYDLLVDRASVASLDVALGHSPHLAFKQQPRLLSGNIGNGNVTSMVLS